jgi:hypothetical protein
MSNRQLTADIVAKAAVAILDNNLVFANRVFRGYEEDFKMRPNGYTVGETISIRRPADYTIRTGPVASAQDVVEGKTTITVDRRRGVDFKFTSQELTLNIDDLAERAIKPAMIQLANEVDSDLAELYKYVPNWAGTPGQKVDSFSDFAQAPELLDEYAVPPDRAAVLSPADHWGLLGSQTSLYMSDVAKGAYRQGSLGTIGGVDTYMSQNIKTLTTGTRSGSPLIDQSITASTITYDAVKDTMEQTIHIDSLGGATDTIKAGEVFTINGVYAVNPVTKARLPFLKQFVVLEDATATANETDLRIYPAMIWTGAHKNVDVVGVSDLNNQGVTFLGNANTSYRQNLVFNKAAFALVSVPLESPPGATQVGRQSYKGLNVRVIPVYDGINDHSMWRLDILYGIKAVDPRRATRLSGKA